MTTPRKSRDPLSEALFLCQDYLLLSPEAKLVLVTLKGLLCGEGMETSWRALVHMLTELTTLQSAAVERALLSLKESGWIHWDGSGVTVSDTRPESTASANDRARRGQRVSHDSHDGKG